MKKPKPYLARAQSRKGHKIEAPVLSATFATLPCCEDMFEYFNDYMEMQGNNDCSLRHEWRLTSILMNLNNLLARRRGMCALTDRPGYVDEKAIGYENIRAISPITPYFNKLKTNKLEC